MSLNLYWQPVVPQERHCLGGHPVKGVLVRAFGDGDGSRMTEFELTAANFGELRMLQRVHDSPSENHQEIRDGIEKVIEAVERYGAVQCFTAD
jgi:hypothetical protein